MPPDSARESPLAPGAKLDGYELLWPVGEGGMASVWVARLTRKHGFEKLVAIKTILPKFAEDESFQKMFLDEARIASRIDHPNVVHIHDLGEKDDILYLVMEYVDGDALTRLRKAVNRKGGSFPVGIALRIMADVCAGLHAAHELKEVDGTPLGVVHRDVSPQNILITTEGSSKLIDFGVAKAAGRLTAETHTGYVKGKVQYMAPEQALGKSVDRRADVWAVGAVIYHLVANRPPFEADNQLALLNLLQKGRPAAPLPPDVPAPVAEVIKKALTHQAGVRFASAAEMRSAIEKTGLVATQEEVAAFVRDHLGDMSERRRGAIAQAIQNVEAAALATPIVTPPVATPAVVAQQAASTQKIDPSQLPRVHAPLGNAMPAGRPPPSADMRIGPPTPHAFLAAAQTNPGLGPKATFPLAAPFAPPPPPQATTTTEPLPPPEALYDNAFNDHTNGGGSLGLASISSSIQAGRPRNVPLIAGFVGGGVLLVGALALAIGMSRGRHTEPDKLGSEFSPLPSQTVAPATSVVAPPPLVVDELPAPDPKAPTAELTPDPAPLPATSASVPTLGVPIKPPAPAGSARRRPRVDDGF